LKSRRAHINKYIILKSGEDLQRLLFLLYFRLIQSRA
jgi:hypothetical protein